MEEEEGIRTEPSVHDGRASSDEDLDERRLEQLGSVEEHIGDEPSSRCSDESASKVGEGELERLHVVPGDGRLLLVGPQLAVRDVVSVVVSVVGEPERHEGDNSKLHPKRPLGGLLAVGRVASASVEDDEQHNQDRLVEERSPLRSTRADRDRRSAHCLN